MTQFNDLSERLISKVAEREGVSENALPSLYGSVETDALEELLKHANTKPDAELEVQFDYAGYIITVQDSEDISIEE